MIPRGNLFVLRRALANVRAIRRAARGLVQITRATETLFFARRVPRAWSLGNQLVMALSADLGSRLPAMTGSSAPDSAVEREGREPKHNLHHRHSSKPSGTETSSPGFKTLLGIFSSVFHSLTVSPRDSDRSHHHESIRRDKVATRPLADFMQSGKSLLGQLASPLAVVLRRALERATRIMNDITEFLKTNSALSDMARWISIVLASVFLLGMAVKFLKSDIFEPFMEGLRLVLSPIFALRWLLAKSVPVILSRLGSLVTKVAVFVDVLAGIEFGSFLLVGGIIAATVALAVAGYELYRHWDAAKRLFSRSIELAHNAVARLMKWIADKISNAAVYAGNSIAGVTATLPNTPHSLATVAATACGLSRARAVEHAAAVTQPAPMFHAFRRAAAAVAFAAPLMLTSAPASAFAAPPLSTNDTARRAAPLSAAGIAQDAIVINYAPNVVIHSEDAADTAALKRRVIEILERHGRELHQVLAREMVRQQRRDFQPRYSNE
jgi:hypothetical protein